jgi:methyl-accepting chemotaxis protein
VYKRQAVKILDEGVAVEENGHGTARIVSLVNILELQAAQLSQTREEMLRAVERILDELRGLVYHVSEISRETVKLLSSAEEAGSTFLWDMRGKMSSVMTLFRTSLGANRELKEAVHRVVETTREISAFVGDIEDIGLEIELIALNARVKAARTGDYGAALGVLAEAIRDLSDRARQDASAVTNTMSEVRSASEDLGAVETGADGESENRAHAMIKKMETLFKYLEKENDDVLVMLKSVESEGRSLAEGIDTLLSGITVHERVQRVLSGARASLDDIAKALRLRLPPDLGQGSGEDIRGLSSRYTMHQERVVHEKHMKRSSTQNNPPGTVHGGDGEEDLGDNVELF